MAEGWARALKGDVVDACSAGVAPQGINARAVQAMAEAGVDISGQRSKHVDEVKDAGLEYVVTVCGHAHETCPSLPGAKVVHAGFDDPPALAKGAATEEEAMVHYRRVRDEIRRFVETLPTALTGKA
jgi:arsenate reductase